MLVLLVLIFDFFEYFFTNSINVDCHWHFNNFHNINQFIVWYLLLILEHFIYLIYINSFYVLWLRYRFIEMFLFLLLQFLIAINMFFKLILVKLFFKACIRFLFQYLT